MQLKDTTIHGDCRIAGTLTVRELIESLNQAMFYTNWDTSNWWSDSSLKNMVVTNSPDNTHGAVLTIKSTNSTASPRGWGMVASAGSSSAGDGNLAFYNNDRKKYMFRMTTTGDVYAGIDANQKVWHQGNDGSGSGLDADLFDGLDSNRYFKFKYPHSYDWEPASASPKTIVGSFHPKIDGDGYISIGATSNTGTNSLDIYLDGDFYAKENKLVWHQGNDGSGSGLDADLLDGNHATAFALASHTHNYLTSFGVKNAPTGSDALTQSGLSMSENASASTGYPCTYGNVLDIKGSGGACNQLVLGWSGTSTSSNGLHENMYYRSKRDVPGTAWSDWAKIWSDKNHGPGSGLNADLLDGKNAADFLLLTGGNMSGSVTFTNSLTGIKWSMNTDGAEIFFKNDSDADADSYLCFKTLDNGNEYFKWIMRSGANDIEKMRLNASGLTVTGDVRATRIFGAVYNDYAEFFEKKETIEPGDVVELDLNSEEETYIKSTGEFSKTVIGVCSDEYYQCIGGTGDKSDKDNYTPIGLAGRVRVKVKGQVNKGDFLVSSDIPGVAMAVTDAPPGTIIGKALENKSTNEISRVRMLIQLH